MKKRKEKIKVLLLTSPAPPENFAYGYRLGQKGEKRFPLGIGYLISVLRKEGISVDFVDLYVNNKDVDFSPYDFIGVYANTLCFKGGTIPLLNKIRESNFDGKIIMGGPHTTVLPQTIPDYVDYIVQGEGEEVILDIIYGKINKHIIKSKRIKNLDKLPLPAYGAFDLSLYDLTFEEFKEAKKVFTCSSSRGCPFNCKFCSAKNFFNRIWTAHSAERIFKDIKYLIKKFKIDGIYFREDNFTVDMNRVRKLCRLLIDNDIKIYWKCETRVDVSYKDLKLMRDAGLKIVYVGFESGSERMLKLFNKQINLKQSKEFVKNCKRLGIYVYGSFIYDVPYETKEDRIQTNKFIKELNLDRFINGKYVAMPGSEFYKDIIKNPELIKGKDTIVIDEKLINDNKIKILKDLDLIIEKYNIKTLLNKEMIRRIKKVMNLSYHSLKVNNKIERGLPSENKFIKSGWYKFMLMRYVLATKFTKNKIVLDSCAGLGWGSYILSSNAKKIYANDYDKISINFINSYWKEPKIKTILSDALFLELPEKVDVVVAMESIEHFTKEDGLKYIDNLVSHLKKEGILIGSTPLTEKKIKNDGNPYHLYIYTLNELKKILNNYFKSVEILNNKIFICNEKLQ